MTPACASLRHARLGIAPVLLASLLAACAGHEKKQPLEGAVSEGIPHQFVSGYPKGQEAEAAERYKLYPGTGVLVKDASTAPAKTGGGDMTLNFEGADLREVVRTILGDILKESYIIDPRVTGSVVLRTTRPIPKSAALPTLEEILKMNSAVLLREADGVYRILPANLAGKGNVTPGVGDVNKPLPSGFSIQIVPLKFIGAQDMAKILEPLSEPGAARPDTLRNFLILAGTQSQIRHMQETIEMFDVDWISGMSVGLFTLSNVEAKTLVGDVEKLFGDKSNPLAGLVRLVPLERLNALLVVTPQAKYLEQARTWIERLDRAGIGGGGPRLFVYQVQNGKAEQIASLLNDAFSKGKTPQKTTPAATLAPGLAAAEVKSSDTVKPETTTFRATASGGDSVALPTDVKVIADKDNNILLVLATAADYERIESALRKLDTVPRQVLIEVTIAEITLKDEFKYGLEWYFNNGARIKGQLDTGKSGIAQLVPGFSYAWTSSVGDITAVLNALATDSKLKVISSPHITVSDNQTAKIKVGDRVPTISQTQSVATTTTTSGIISSVQYVETGVQLSVTPRINAGGLVNMDISQEVSNAVANTISGIDSPTIQQRTAQSKVTIQSGETLILAGLINESQSKGSEGLPLLSRIPLLGGLFGTESWSDNRTELIILITPHVLHTTRQASEVTEEFRKRLTGLEELIKDARLETRAPASEPTPNPGLPAGMSSSLSRKPVAR
jgi:general secretion pathway protein D